MSQWARANPHLVGSPSDPSMVNEGYRRHAPMPESVRDLLREERERGSEDQPERFGDLHRHPPEAEPGDDEQDER